MAKHNLEFRLFDSNRTHDTSGDYDPDFLDRYGRHKDLMGYYQTLRKDPNDVSAKEDAGKCVYGDSEFYKDPSIDIFSDLETLLSLNSEFIGRYGEKNDSALYDRLSKDDYKKLIQKVPLYQREGEKDENVEKINEFIEIQRMGGSQETMIQFLQREAQKMQDTEYAWLGFLLQSNMGNEGYIRKVFDGYLRLAHASFQQVMENADAEQIFKDSLEEAKKEFDEETLDKEKADIWKNNLKPYHLALADQAYEIEDRNSNKDIPEWKEKRNERRARRRKNNMPF